MNMFRKCIVPLALNCLLIAACCLSARADSPSLPAMFLKCDGLLGKSSKAVLAVLGQPDVATNQDLSGFRIRLLLWQYKDHDPETRDFGASIKLVFLPNHTLVFVAYDGLNLLGDSLAVHAAGRTAFKDGGKATLRQILRTYNTSTLKVGYKEDYAKARLVPGQPTTKIESYNIVIKAISKNNNSFCTLCAVEAPNPFALRHNFDANSGVYKDTFSANPDFKIDRALFGDLIISSPNMNNLKTIPNGSDIYEYIYHQTSASTNYPVTLSAGISTMHFVPVTDKIMPWLYQSP